MTQPNAPENPSTTPPVDPSHEEMDNPGSFEEQLAGIGEYVKQAALAAAAAVAEGHPEQVLDLIENLLTSYSKIRYFKPLTELIDKVKAERKEARDKARASWKESHEHWWTVAERELDFMKRAKDAGLSEDGCFALLERTFPPAPEEPEEAEENPLARATDAMVEALAKYIAAATGGGGGGCGGGCFGRATTLADLDAEGDIADPAVRDQILGGPPIMPLGGKRPARRAPVQYAQAVPIHACPSCQRNMQAAVDQFMAAHPHMVQRSGAPHPMSVGLDDLAPRPRDPSFVTQQQAAALTIEDQLSRYGKEVGNLSQLAHVASHYGAPSVPLGGANVLSQMGVHTGARLHSVVETAGLDPKMVMTSQPVPPWEPSYVPPASPLAKHNTFDLLQHLWDARVLHRDVDGVFFIDQAMARAFERLIEAEVRKDRPIEVPYYRVGLDHSQIPTFRAANVAPANNEIACPECSQPIVIFDGPSGTLTATHKPPSCRWFTIENLSKFVNEALRATLGEARVDEVSTASPSEAH